MALGPERAERFLDAGQAIVLDPAPDLDIDCWKHKPT